MRNVAVLSTLTTATLMTRSIHGSANASAWQSMTNGIMPEKKTPIKSDHFQPWSITSVSKKKWLDVWNVT